MQKMAGQNGDLKKNVRNKGTMKRPNVSNKGVNIKPQPGGNMYLKLQWYSCN